jgi:hypothetical protein
MKTIRLLMFVIISSIFQSCSNNDGEITDSSLSQIEQKLIGKWNTSSNLKGNTYSYKSDKTATYVNTYYGETTTYIGAWAIIDGDILIEYYPDEGEVWDKNWKQNPTLKNKIEFVDNKTVKLTDFYSSSNVNIHYKEN